MSNEEHVPARCRLFGHRWGTSHVREEGMWRVHGCSRCDAEQHFVGTPLDRRYWSHPSWRLRFLSGWWKWIVAGRPTDIPVVRRAGKLIAYSDGTGSMPGWHFDVSRMRGTVVVDDLWDRLSAEYPVERQVHSAQEGS